MKQWYELLFENYALNPVKEEYYLVHATNEQLTSLNNSPTTVNEMEFIDLNKISFKSLFKYFKKNEEKTGYYLVIETYHEGTKTMSEYIKKVCGINIEEYALIKKESSKKE